MVPKQDPKSKFQEGERVLRFHGPLLYEAKRVKVAIKDKQVKYFIHYSGWNKNWDEWVPESRVLKYVDVNLQKRWELQKANQKQYAEGKMRGAAPGKKTAGLQERNTPVKQKRTKTPGNGRGGSTSETPQSPCKKRARVDPTVENEATFMSRVKVKDSWRTETMACWWLGLNYIAKTALLSSFQEECAFHSRGLCKLQEILRKHR